MANSPTANYSLEEAVESIGFGPGQLIILAVTGGVFAADAMEILMISFILPGVITDFDITPWEASFLTSAVFIGMLLGAFPTGILSDKFGRKKIIQIWTLVGILFAFGSAIAPGYWILVITRCGVGFSIAGASHLCFSLFAECLPSGRRGFWMMVFVSLWAAGSVLEALLAWVIIPNFGWRWLVTVTAFPLIFSLIGFPFIGESPKYFLASNNSLQAEESLLQIATRNSKKLPEGNLISHDTEDVESKRGNVWDLVPNRTYARLTLLVMFLWGLNSFVYYGVILLTPAYLKDLDSNSMYLGSVLSAAAEFPGNLTASATLDRIGRIPTLCVSFLLCLIAFIISMYPIGFTLGVIATMVSRGSIVAAFNTIWVYTPEAYPTKVRATAMGMGSSVARIAGIITPFVASGLIEIYYFLPFLIYIAASALGFLASFLLPFETKGLSLPDLHHDCNFVDETPEKVQSADDSVGDCVGANNKGNGVVNIELQELSIEH